MNQMMFGIRFRLPPRLEVELSDHQCTDGHGQRLNVSQDEFAIHLRSVDRFATKDEADAALQKTLRGLSILGVFIGYGIDDFRSSAGDSRAPGPPENLRITIVLDEEEFPLERSIRMLNKLETVPEKYERAANFFDDATCVTHATDALILRTTGLEVLSERQPVEDRIRESIDQLLEYTKKCDVDEAARERLLNSLGQQKTETIGEAVRRHVMSVVPEVPQEAITRIYACRSRLVHGDVVDRSEVFINSENAKLLLRHCILRGLGFELPDATLQL